MSIDQLQRFLRDQLGHPTYVDGGLVREAGGLVLAVRVGAKSHEFRGTPAELQTMTVKAAEAVFAATQPRGFGDYLLTVGRAREALPVYKRMAAVGDRTNRAWGYTGWGDALRQMNQANAALGRYQEAAELQPDLWVVWQNMADLQMFTLQQPEAALHSRERVIAAPTGAGAITGRTHFYRDFNRVYVSEARGDYATALQTALKLTHIENDQALAYQAADMVAYEAVYLHDNVQSAAWSRRMADRAADQNAVSASQRTLRLAHWRLTNIDEWAEAAATLEKANLSAGYLPQGEPGAVNNPRDEAFERGFDTQVRTGPRLRGGYFRALQQIAHARAGQVAAAQALSRLNPPACYDCVVADAVTAEAAGDRTGADRLFAQAMRMGPSLVRADRQAAGAHLRRGDFDGAIAIAKAAVTKSPRFHDGLEIWGEALMAKGELKPAIAKFKATAELAPNWGRNRLLWGQALRRLGKADQAREQLLLARGLALSKADRAALDADLAALEG